jgi:predicted small secreted protein
MKKITLSFVKVVGSLFVLASLSACSTMEGLGKDIQSLGSSIQGSAKKPDANAEAQKAPPSGAVVTPIK